ncbi:uncharacterized protein [Physcomitrium patens]|uniref:uncharacterized protein isoform X2 n=1 Tax=Physcomitrium patens TaxID=3218 RepID=UPI003CCCAEC2
MAPLTNELTPIKKFLANWMKKPIGLLAMVDLETRVSSSLKTDQEKCQTRIGLGDLFSTSDVMGEDHHDVQVHLSSSNSFSIVQAHILSIPCFYYVVKW